MNKAEEFYKEHFPENYKSLLRLDFVFRNVVFNAMQQYAEQEGREVSLKFTNWHLPADMEKETEALFEQWLKEQEACKNCGCIPDVCACDIIDKNSDNFYVL